MITTSLAQQSELTVVLFDYTVVLTYAQVQEICLILWFCFLLQFHCFRLAVTVTVYL